MPLDLFFLPPQCPSLLTLLATLFQLTTLPHALLRCCSCTHPHLQLHKPLCQLSPARPAPPLRVPPLAPNQCAWEAIPSHILTDLASSPLSGSSVSPSTGLFASANKCLLQKQILPSYKQYKRFSWPHLPSEPPPYRSALFTNISKPYLYTVPTS